MKHSEVKEKLMNGFDAVIAHYQAEYGIENGDICCDIAIEIEEAIDNLALLAAKVIVNQS